MSGFFAAETGGTKEKVGQQVLRSLQAHKHEALRMLAPTSSVGGGVSGTDVGIGS
jgi:hypothetical protein